MRHFRIKEIIRDKESEYIIQYTKKFLFIKYWKKYSEITYKKYEDALLEARRAINLQKDYTKVKKNKTIKHHYIDAFETSRRDITRIKAKKKPIRNEKNRFNKSKFVPKNITK